MRSSTLFAGFSLPILAVLWSVILVPGGPVQAVGSSVTIIDIANLTAGIDPLIRASGIDNDNGGMFPLGVLGTPVAGGFDVDGDGFNDFGVGHQLSSPLNRFAAGQINLVFGDGTSSGHFDLQQQTARVLRIFGAGNLMVAEQSGSEIWMGDVTGDGLGDLLICRQNFSVPGDPDPRFGAGAISILVGSPKLREIAESLTTIDLANPPDNVTIYTIVGPHAFSRLGIWARTGDVDGDGTTDFVVAADQESGATIHHGALYVVRGGSHLNQNATIDLADFGNTGLAGNIARITPPSGSNEFHFGATCQVGDLDNNGRAEVMASAALNRAGAVLGPFGPDPMTTHPVGGPPGGRSFIVWDDAFPDAPWPNGFHIDLDNPVGGVTSISGGVGNGTFGEEILGGLDYSGDGLADFFLGDLVGDGTPNQTRPFSGVGYVFYDAATLKGLDFNIDFPPPGVRLTTILGPSIGAIGSDTVAQGDFNGDGIGDLMIGNPTDSPLGRLEAGTMTILFGQNGEWPALIDTAPPVDTQGLQITEVRGALGGTNFSSGDILCYSAASGDIDGDNRTDLIVNEMTGDGVSPFAIDSGNLLVLPGSLVSPVDTFLRGDADGSGAIEGIPDSVYIFNFQFLEGPVPPCPEAADVNDDGQFEGLSDGIYLLNFEFLMGPAPGAPFPECSTDPDPANSLGCGPTGCS